MFKKFGIFRRRSFPDGVLKISDHIVWKNIGKDSSLIVALNLKSGFFYTFENVQAQIWRLCDGKNTVKAIIQKIQKEIPDVRDKEIKRFIEKLLKEDLVCLRFFKEDSR